MQSLMLSVGYRFLEIQGGRDSRRPPEAQGIAVGVGGGQAGEGLEG